MLASAAFSTARRNRGLVAMSPPPRRAPTVISLIRRVQTLPRLASVAAFLCLMLAHLLCPAMTTLSSNELVRMRYSSIRAVASAQNLTLKILKMVCNFNIMAPVEACRRRGNQGDRLYVQRLRAEPFFPLQSPDDFKHRYAFGPPNISGGAGHRSRWCGPFFRQSHRRQADLPLRRRCGDADCVSHAVLAAVFCRHRVLESLDRSAAVEWRA